MEFDLQRFFDNFIQEIEKGNSQIYIDDNIDKIKNCILSLADIYKKYSKWIVLDKDFNKDVFINPKILTVGDIHADYESLKKIISIKLNYPELILIFLGDYVDRGRYSNEILILVILLNLIFPDTVFLLPGNHELYHYFGYQNPEFWIQNGKITKLFDSIRQLIEFMPIIISFNDILFIHGGVFDFNPEVKKDTEFINILKNEKGCRLNKLIFLDKDKVFDISWADFADNYKDAIYSRSLGRPVKTEEDFLKWKNYFGFNMIIRGHQPLLKGSCFGKKVITLITSSLYKNIGRMDGLLTCLIYNKKQLSFDENEKKISDEIKLVFNKFSQANKKDIDDNFIKEKIFTNDFEVDLVDIESY
ncbi:MAG TPA: metallophosphoesterase family protein [Exilispira sp.]|nr:metallophosphoesterase family protein [Exilispira sp.]